MKLSIALGVLVGAVSARVLEKRQTANDLLTALNEVSVNIPNECVATCNPFLTDLQACPATAAAITACACTTAMLTDTTNCLNCFTAANNALGATLLATVQGACANGGAAVAITTSSTALAAAAPAATTAVTSAAATTVVGNGVSINPATVVLNTASPTSFSPTAITTTLKGMSLPTVVTASLSEGGYEPFPQQTKSSNVFTGGAATIRNSVYALSAAALVAVVFA